ncbi:hypothetical protein [Maribacter spongiicola]|uniref:hypothetical protein n=1 Tax=Maribacter spongiicola TaxID=1206753 RepID=UPI003F9CC29F
MRNSIESVLTRGISILSKFLLLGYLAKILSLEDYGSFQLISYFIMISTSIFGLEYYNISNRNIVKADTKDEIYIGHLRFFYTLSPLIFILQILVFLALFPSELITLSNIFLILIIGILDYFSQEAYRYFMINKLYRKGNVQLIYKSGFFIILILLYEFFFLDIDFKVLLQILLLSYIILFLVVYKVFSKHLFQFTLKNFKYLKFSELKKILTELTPFLLLIFFLKGIEFFDKFLIGKQVGLEETGIYSFLFSMASVLGVFVISGFYIIYLPQLIDNFKRDKKEFKKVFFKFSMLTVTTSIVIAIVIVFISPYVFEIIDKEIMLKHIDVLYLLLIGFVLHNTSLIPHVFLYVCHDERKISLIMGCAFIVNLVLNLFMIPEFGIMGAGYSFVITYIVVLVFKSIRAIMKWKKVVV